MKLYVISKKDTDYLEKGKKYMIVNADYYEYQIEYMPKHYTWIGKGDTEHFEYHV